MRRAEVTSVHHERPAGVARRFQAAEDDVGSPSAEMSDVLSEYPTGSQLAHEPQHLPPQSAALAVHALLGSCAADVLAGEAAGQDADGREVGAVDEADVAVLRDARPVPAQDAAALGIRLDLPGAPEPGPLQAKVEPADAAEQRAEVHFIVAV